MKIIEQSHKIISLPDNILGLIEMAARTCYKSEDKVGCMEDHWEDGSCPEKESDLWDEYCVNAKCSAHSSHKLTKMLISKGHHAMLEFADITVRFITNRGVTHELVRHRLCSFAQESTRYVRYDGQMEFIRPVWWNEVKEYEQSLWIEAMNKAEHFYSMLLDGKWRPEQAREVLPNSLKTEIVVKANLREIRHILDLRCNKKAHPQIRHLMLPFLKELHEKIPVLFDDLYDKYNIEERT